MQQTQHQFASLGVALLVALTVASSSVAQPPSPDLTGTWEGGWSCNTLSDGEPSVQSNDEVVVEISHVSDNEVRMSLFDGGLPYNGFAVGWEGYPNRGAVTFVACSTRPDDIAFNEIASLRFDLATGKMGGFSTYNERLTFVGGACRWSITRVDIADPGVQPCPPE